jgi:hypothetical protein
VGRKRMKGLELFFYPRNPVKKEDATSTLLGYLGGYLTFYRFIYKKGLYRFGVSPLE